MHKEEAEQIDEISRKTVMNYYDKATGSKRGSLKDLKGQSKDAEKNIKRWKTPGHEHWQDAIPDEQKRKAHWDNKAEKRQQGIDRARARLTKEEVEGLDEISKELATHYKEKSLYASPSDQEKEKPHQKVNRLVGASRAIRKKIGRAHV